MTDLISKLQLKDNMGGSIINQPKDVELGFTAKPGDDYVIVFVSSVGEVVDTCGGFI